MIFDLFMTLAGGAVGLGSALGKDVRRDVTNHYDRAVGRNLDRQHELLGMVDNNRAEFERLAGRELQNRQNPLEVARMVKDIAKKEGWLYTRMYGVNGL